MANDVINFAFFSNNNFVPKANLKALSLLYDIKRKKPSMDLKEGQFYSGIPGYTIKVQNKIDDTRANNVLVDHTPEIDKLANIFYDICEDWFDNIERLTENTSERGMPRALFSHQIWAYVQTRNKFVSAWHSHVTQCTINGVYYAAVPDPTGTLSYIETFLKDTLHPDLTVQAQ